MGVYWSRRTNQDSIEKTIIINPGNYSNPIVNEELEDPYIENLLF